MHISSLPLWETDFLMCISLYSLVNYVQRCYLTPQGWLRKEWVTSSKVSQSWKLIHISSQLQSRVGGNELGWECSQCRKQQTTNTTVSPRADAQSAAHQCLTPPIWTHDCQSIQNVSHCSRQGPGLFQRKFGILKMKSTADYSRLKVSKEAWPNAMCKS